MACDARRITTRVIAWIVNAGVTVCRCGYPCSGAMACIALQRCYKVSLALASCLCAIVTATAIAGDIGVIKTGWYPCVCIVAVATGVAAGNVID